MAIEAGLVGEVQIVVQPADTAAALGNTGVDVLATPRLVALLELAAIRAVEAELPPGAGTVGTRIDVRHLAATRADRRPVPAPSSGKCRSRIRRGPRSSQRWSGIARSSTRPMRRESHSGGAAVYSTAPIAESGTAPRR